MSLYRTAVRRGLPLAGAAATIVLALPISASAHRATTANGYFTYDDSTLKERRIDTPTLSHCYPLEAGDTNALNATSATAIIYTDTACKNQGPRPVRRGERNDTDEFGSVEFR